MTTGPLAKSQVEWTAGRSQRSADDDPSARPRTRHGVCVVRRGARGRARARGGARGRAVETRRRERACGRRTTAYAACTRGHGRATAYTVHAVYVQQVAATQRGPVSGKRPSSSTPQPALSPPHCTIEHSDLANAIRYLNSPHEPTLRAPVTTDRPAGGLPKAERRARGQKRACSLGAGPAQRLPKPCVDLDRMRRLSHRLSASACAPHTSPHLSPK